MTIATMRNNLLRFTPGLHPELVDSTIQDAYRKLASKDWNRLKLQRQIYTAIPYSTGTISITTGGVVTGVGTTFTAAMVGRFMRVSTYSDSLFEISVYTNSTTITLKDWTGEVVAAGATYEILKTIYTVDATFGQVWDVVYQTSLGKRSQTFFNETDPTRTATSSTPIYWAFAGLSTAGVIQIELYPPCTVVVPLRVYGKYKITTLGVSDVPYLPEDLIEAYALFDCYRLKDVQQPGLGWGQKITEHTAFYADLLSTFEMEDDQLDSTRLRVRDAMDDFPYPIDDTFAAEHDVGD